jgi:integrase
MASKSRSKSNGTVTPYATKKGQRYRWQAFVPLNPFNPNGGSKRGGKAGFLTYKEADADMQDALANVRQNRLAIPGDTLFADFAYKWLDSQRLANATLKGYEKIIRVHLVPHLGTMKLAEISGQTIGRLYTDLLKHGNKGRTTSGLGLSSNSVNKVHILLGSILEEAHLEGLVNFNEARRNPKVVKAPTGKNIRQEQEEIKPWTISQVKSFLAWDKDVHNDDFHPLWHLFLFSGMRRGEGVALKWEDVNFDNNTVRIRRASDSGLRKAVKETKTGKPRVIPLDEKTMLMLAAHKVERSKLGPDQVSPSAFIFGNLDGSVRNPGDVGERWSKTISKALVEVPELHHLTIKGMRHTHATLLLETGAKMKAVQERLGHSNITTTLNIYSHSTETMQQEAVDLFMNCFS